MARGQDPQTNHPSGDTLARVTSYPSGSRPRAQRRVSLSRGRPTKAAPRSFTVDRACERDAVAAPAHEGQPPSHGPRRRAVRAPQLHRLQHGRPGRATNNSRSTFCFWGSLGGAGPRADGLAAAPRQASKSYGGPLELVAAAPRQNPRTEAARFGLQEGLRRGLTASTTLL